MHFLPPSVCTSLQNGVQNSHDVTIKRKEAVMVTLYQVQDNSNKFIEKIVTLKNIPVRKMSLLWAGYNSSHLPPQELGEWSKNTPMNSRPCWVTSKTLSQKPQTNEKMFVLYVFILILSSSHLFWPQKASSDPSPRLANFKSRMPLFHICETLLACSLQPPYYWGYSFKFPGWNF